MTVELRPYIEGLRARREAERRAAELGVEDANAMAEALAKRDEIDSNRTASPLTQAADAVVVDGTHLTLEEVIDHIVGLVPS